MMDIAATFRRYCGPSVQFVGETREGRRLTITYMIPAMGDSLCTVSGELSNGLSSMLHRMVKILADRARNDAYRRTGHRDADLKHLLSGRTL
jgi:hypothetical protein